MHEWESLAHVRWDCKYHVVFMPKYRQKVLYGKMRRHIGEILRELCRQKGIRLLAGRACQTTSICVSAYHPSIAWRMQSGF